MDNKSKKIISLLCLAFYILVLTRPLLPYLEFIINQDFIATVLCINREKPEIECGGKCHLTKQLQKAGKSDTEQQKPATSTNRTEQLPLAITESTYCVRVDFTDNCRCRHNSKTLISDHTAAPPTPPPRFIRS